jgi:hypothetical protein
MTEALFSLAEVAPEPPANRRPQWLETILKDPPRRHPRVTHWQPCNRCGLLILEGDDADILAIKTKVDPTPLQNDRVAEAHAILQGRLFYLAAPAGRPHAWKLHATLSDHISDTHRGTTTLILPDHHCAHGYLTEPLLAQEPDPKPFHPDDPLKF